jgi:hypothetical protein
MPRLDAESLAIHLEVALATAPRQTLDRFRSSDRCHSPATTDLARYLADRMAGLELPGEDQAVAEGQPSLFDGEC